MQRMILVGSQQMLYKQFQLEARWAQIYAEVVFTIANTAVVIFSSSKILWIRSQSNWVVPELCPTIP